MNLIFPNWRSFDHDSKNFASKEKVRTGPLRLSLFHPHFRLVSGQSRGGPTLRHGMGPQPPPIAQRPEAPPPTAVPPGRSSAPAPWARTGPPVTSTIASRGPSGTERAHYLTEQRPMEVPGTVESVTIMTSSCTLEGSSGKESDSDVARAGRSVGRGTSRLRTTVAEIIRTRPEGLDSKKGVEGNKIDLVTNYFKFIKRPDWKLFQYRVDFSPEEDRLGARKGMVRQLSGQLGIYVFDGTMLFSLTKLTDGVNPLTLTTKRPGGPPAGHVSRHPVMYLLRGSDGLHICRCS